MFTCFFRTGKDVSSMIWFAQNGVLTVCLACVMNKRTIIGRNIYALEKIIYGLKKTVYGFEVISAG